jgi:hypothetical protein
VGNLGLAGDAGRVRVGLRRRLGLLDTVDGNYNVLFQLGWIVTVPGLC